MNRRSLLSRFFGVSLASQIPTLDHSMVHGAAMTLKSSATPMLAGTLLKSSAPDTATIAAAVKETLQHITFSLPDGQKIFPGLLTANAEDDIMWNAPSTG